VCAPSRRRARHRQWRPAARSRHSRRHAARPRIVRDARPDIRPCGRARTERPPPQARVCLMAAARAPRPRAAPFSCAHGPDRAPEPACHQRRDGWRRRHSCTAARAGLPATSRRRRPSRPASSGSDRPRAGRRFATDDRASYVLGDQHPCASSVGVAMPPAIGRSGAGVWAIEPQARQAYFGRAMRRTRSCAGTQPSISLTLSPMERSLTPQHPHARLSTSSRTSSRGR
jgi:hypothetical protein